LSSFSRLSGEGRVSCRSAMDRAKKKFANALDGLKSLGNRNEMSIDVEERLLPEHCTLTTVVRHGFPDDAKCLAYDPVQRLIAIGTGRGSVRVLGELGVDYQMVHPTDHAVTKILFCINEGALVTACSNEMVHLWNFRQKHPEILHSLQMSKEGITSMHLPYGGRWLIIGTEKGNVYFVCISSFQLSTYVINWNKAIDIACRVHPGAVRQISTCPTDHTKIAIVFEKGVVALWDLVTKTAERLPMDPPVKCLSWHYNGQSLITGNVDGSICIYNAKKCTEVFQKSTPHGTGSCRPIHQVEWRHANEADQFLVFSGGMPSDDNLPIPAITVLRGSKSATVMEMEHPIVTFVTLNSIPLENFPQQPHGIAVLLKNSFMLIDLLAPQYPTIDCPHSLDIHESPVTTVVYYSDCPSDLMGALTLVGCKQRKKGLSERKWPINGGIGRDCATGHQELVLTGHKDGSIRFWAASGEDLQILYRLKAASHFERLEETESLKDVSHAIKTIELCLDSRLLLVTGVSGQVTLFRFVKQEGVNVIAAVSIPVLAPPPPATASTSSGIGSSIEEKPREMRRQHKLMSESSRRQSSETSDEGDERIVPFKIRGGAVKRPPGYQPELSCLVPWRSSSSADSITATALNSAFGVMAIGTASGLALVDITQCALIYAWSSAELYGSDPTPAVQLGSLSLGDSSPIEMPYGASLEADELGEDVAVSMPPTSPKWSSEAAPAAPHGTPPTIAEEPMIRPAGRSHSVKGSSGIMRRLTNKGHSIARSFSLHVKENGEGDISPRQGVTPVGAERMGGMNGSPSTSCASLERSGRNIGEASTSAEGVTSLSFMHTFTKRGDKSSSASLWVGTSGGACIALNLLLPPDRITCSVVVSPSAGTSNGDPPSISTGTRFVKAYSLGTVIRARGACIGAVWMDASLCVIEPPFEKYRENNAQASPDRCSTNKVVTKESLSPVYAPQQETVSPDELAQVVVIISEWEIRAVALPSFALLFVHKCQEIPFVKARSTHIRGHPSLMTLTAAGQISVFSLPSLRPLLTSQLLPRSIDIDDPACQRMSLSEHGLGVYMASPSELEKYTVCGELAEQASESMGDLFVPMEVADPNAAANGGNGGAGSFLKGIFSGGGSTPRGAGPADLDGILTDKPGPSGTSGSVAMRTVGRTIPGPARMDRAASGSVSAGQAAAMALQNLNERSEKLNATVDATENLKNNASNLASRTSKLVEKMEKKKWYNF
ncbi:hypothetical protein PMAYCL1PPCAC_24108, partial [Pristionchus mayeri]